METTHVTTLADGTALRLEMEGSYLGDRRFDRFIEVLEASAPVRDALRLTPDRMAALAMLDELRGLFATGELAAARRLGDRCFHDLQHAFGMPAIASEAIVGRPITKEPRIMGWLVEYALATAPTNPSEALGRVRALVRLAADLDGGPRSPLETRPDRVRRHLFDRPPVPDLEQIALPLPAVHPAMWSAVAEHLGTTVEDAREQLVYGVDPSEYGRDARERVAGLPEAMLIRSVPRIPADERPPRIYPPRDRFGAATKIEDDVTTCEQAIVALAPYVESVLDPNAPAIVAMLAQSGVQRAVEDMAAAARGEDDPFTRTAWSGAGEFGDNYDAPKIVDNGNPARPSCVWLTEDTAAIAVAGIARVQSLSTGVVHHTFPIGDLRLQACDDSGRFLLVGPVDHLVDYLPGTGFGCRDLEAGAWIDEPPPNLPAVGYLHSLNEPNPSDPRGSYAQLVDFRTAATIDLGSPDDADDADDADEDDADEWRVCFARGNAAVMERHGLRATATGFIEVAPAILVARAADDATPVHHTPHASGAAREIGTSSACARVAGRWRFLLANGVVAEGDRALLRLTWPVCAASFSPDGRQLLVVGEHDIVVVDLERAAVVHVLPQ
jgi:hypothetical protein